jgi:TolB-like protein
MIAVVLAAGGWYTFMRPGPGQRVATALPSVAVLPFKDMSGNAAPGYFGDGVAEDIISMLSRVPDLKVLGRNSSFLFKGEPIDLRKIGSELGVTHVLEGSVRMDSGRLRIVAQLVETRTGENVWAERFDRSGTDPWEIQDEVTEKIVAVLAGDAGTLKKAQYRQSWGKDHADLEEYDFSIQVNPLDGFFPHKKRPLHIIVDKLKVCKSRSCCAWTCANWSAETSPACVGRRA